MTSDVLPPIPLSSWLNACTRGKIDQLEQMAQGRPWPDLQASTPSTTALILSCGNGHLEVCKRLLANKPLLEAKNEMGQTALFCAVEDDHQDVAQALLDAGADPLVRDNAGRSLIMMAACNGNPHMASLIYKYGTHDLNVLANNGLSCIAAAMDKGSNTMVHWLLDRGADPDIKDGETKLTPLWKAVYEDNAGIAQALLVAGAKPNRRDTQGHCYLHVAIEQKNDRVIHVLLDGGADPYKPDRNNITPFEYAKDWPRFAELVAEGEQRKLDANTLRVEPKKRAARL
jgi:ankyrin repeat protein